MLKSSLHLLRSCTKHRLQTAQTKTELVKAPKPAQSNMFTVVCRAWHIFHILPEMRNGIRSCEWVSLCPGAVPGTVLTQQPCWRARASSGFGASLCTLNWMKMLEKTQLLPAAKDYFPLWGSAGDQRGTVCCVSASCARLRVCLTIKKMSCYWLMEEGNVHLRSSPPSLPKERANQFIRNVGVLCHLAAFAQHPTVQGHVPGAKQPLAVLLPWWSKISMIYPCTREQNTQMLKSATVFWPRTKQ